MKLQFLLKVKCLTKQHYNKGLQCCGDVLTYKSHSLHVRKHVCLVQTTTNVTSSWHLIICCTNCVVEWQINGAAFKCHRYEWSSELFGTAWHSLYVLLHSALFRWRTKQNLDYSFLMMYAVSKGVYYVQVCHWKQSCHSSLLVLG